MEVTYTLEAEDYWQLNLFVISRDWNLKFSYGLSLVLFPILGILAGIVGHMGPAWTVILAIIIGVPGSFYSRWVFKRRVMGYLKKHKGLLGRFEMTIAPDGLRSANPTGDKKMPWKDIAEVAQNEKYVFLITEKKTAYPIPKKAFGEAGESDRFFQAARGFLAGVKGKAKKSE